MLAKSFSKLIIKTSWENTKVFDAYNNIPVTLPQTISLTIQDWIKLRSILKDTYTTTLSISYRNSFNLANIKCNEGELGNTTMSKDAANPTAPVLYPKLNEEDIQYP